MTRVVGAPSAWTILGIVRRHARALSVATICDVVGSLAIMASPILVGLAINAYREEDGWRLVRILAAMVMTMVAGIAGTVTRQWVCGAIEIDVKCDVAQAIEERISNGGRLPARYVGELPVVVGSDAESLGSVFAVLSRCAGAAAAGLGAMVWLLLTSLRIGVVVLIGVPLVMALTSLAVSPVQRRVDMRRDRIGDLSPMVTDVARGLRILIGLGGRRTIRDRYHAASMGVAEAESRLSVAEAVLRGLSTLLPIAVTAGAVWLAATEASRGDISVGQVTAIYGVSALLAGPIQTMVASIRQIADFRVSAARLTALLSGTDSTDDDEAATACVAAPPGTGLSRVAEAVLRQTGVVVVESTDLQSARLLANILWSSLAQHLTTKMVTPDQQLFTGTLSAAVAPGGTVCGAPASHSIEGVLRATLADDVVDRLQHGVDEMIDEGSSQFSGGEYQRLLLARGLALDPEILILVNPSAGLDESTDYEVAQRVAAYRENSRTLVVGASAAWRSVATSVFRGDTGLKPGLPGNEGSGPDETSRPATPSGGEHS